MEKPKQLHAESTGGPESIPDYVEILSKNLERAIERMMSESPQDEELEAKKEYLISHFIERGFGNLFPENTEGLTNFLDVLRETHFSSVQEMVRGMSVQISQFMLANHSPEQLEIKLRDLTAEQGGWIIINEALTYHIEGDEIDLHVPMILTKKPMEMFRLLNTGLRTLAVQLKTDTDLEHIEKIAGESWIVLDHPDLLERMGFVIVERDEKKQRGTAQMTREDFIARYAN